MIPQLIFLGLVVLGMGVALAKDGTPQTGKTSFGFSFVCNAIVCGILYWGGFFDCFFK